GEEDPLPELRHPGDVLDAADHARGSQRPSASASLRFAPSLAACRRTVRLRGGMPSPSSFTSPPRARARPCATRRSTSTVAPSPKGTSAPRLITWYSVGKRLR